MVRIQLRNVDKPKRFISCSIRSIFFCLAVFFVLYLVALSTITVHVNHGHNDKPTDEIQSSSHHGSNTLDTPMTIGVASTVTGCGEEPFQDGAAVLKYSLDQHRAGSGQGGGKFNYQMYILYHPDAKACVLPLQTLGYTLLERPTPVAVQDIRGEDLRERIVENGCCGEVRVWVGPRGVISGVREGNISDRKYVCVLCSLLAAVDRKNSSNWKPIDSSNIQSSYTWTWTCSF
jgi:hypothetical protein